MDHVTVADRARPATVVSCHAADGGAAGGRRIDGKKQSMELEKSVEPVEDDPRLHTYGAPIGIEVEHAVEVFRGIDHQGLRYGLAALGGATAPGQHRRPFVCRDFDGAPDVLIGPGHDHADGFDLVDGGVGAVSAAGEGVEQYVSLQFAAEAVGEGRAVDARGPLVGCCSEHGPAGLLDRVRGRSIHYSAEGTQDHPPTGRRPCPRFRSNESASRAGPRRSVNFYPFVRGPGLARWFRQRCGG